MYLRVCCNDVFLCVHKFPVLTENLALDLTVDGDEESEAIPSGGVDVPRAVLDLCWGTGGSVYAEFLPSSLASLCALLPRQLKVIDLGSGSGTTLVQLAKNLSAQCVGYEECSVRFDISLRVLASLPQELRERVTFIKLNLMNLLSLPRGCITFAFDLVFVPPLMVHLEQLQRKYALYVCTNKPKHYYSDCWRLVQSTRMSFRFQGGTTTMHVFLNTSL